MPYVDALAEIQRRARYDPALAAVLLELMRRQEAITALERELALFTADPEDS